MFNVMFNVLYVTQYYYNQMQMSPYSKYIPFICSSKLHAFTSFLKSGVDYLSIIQELVRNKSFASIETNTVVTIIVSKGYP